MKREDLINQIVEELVRAADLGTDEVDIAKNILALITGGREHLDYDFVNHKYTWEDDDA